MRTWIVKQLFQVFFGSVSKAKRDRDHNAVRTLRERGKKLHRNLERKSTIGRARRKNSLNKDFYEAEADVEVRHWEKKKFGYCFL